MIVHVLLPEAYLYNRPNNGLKPEKKMLYGQYKEQRIKAHLILVFAYPAQ